MLSRRQLPPRVALVQAELSLWRRPRYLEIGVFDGTLFFNVRAHRKIGVDPSPRIRRRQWLKRPLERVRSRIVRATSDDYFASLDPAVRFEVVFVDGYHSYPQALRDVEGSLGHLAEGGTVMLHDCYPPTAAAAAPTPPRAGQGSGEGWCGDVWKAIAHLRATRRDLTVEVLDTDFGIGIVRRGEADPIDLPLEEMGALRYEDLRRDAQRLIGLQPATRRSP